MRGPHTSAWAFFVLKFKKTWLVNSVATNATAATIGIYDDTAGIQAVAAGTAMQNDAPGQYSYAFTTALREHAYTATVSIVYAGRTYTSNETAPATVHGDSPSQSRPGSLHDLSDAIAANAASAESVQSAAGSVKAHPLTDQIAADQYLASKRAAQRGRPGIRIMRREGNASG